MWSICLQKIEIGTPSTFWRFEGFMNVKDRFSFHFLDLIR
jgi:hypothetical protein